MQIFSLHGRLYQFCVTLWQMLVLNCVFLLSCVPLLTIGASVIALNEAMEGVLHDEYSLKKYWKTWASSLAIGMILELGVLVTIAVVAALVALLSYWKLSSLWATPFLVIFALLLLIMPFLFLLPARQPRARHPSALIEIFSTAFSLAFETLLPAMLLTVIGVGVVVASVFAWQLLPVFVLLGFAFISLVQNVIFDHLIISDNPEPYNRRVRKGV